MSAKGLNVLALVSLILAATGLLLHMISPQVQIYHLRNIALFLSTLALLLSLGSSIHADDVKWRWYVYFGVLLIFSLTVYNHYFTTDFSFSGSLSSDPTKPVHIGGVGTEAFQQSGNDQLRIITDSDFYLGINSPYHSSSLVFENIKLHSGALFYQPPNLPSSILKDAGWDDLTVVWYNDTIRLLAKNFTYNEAESLVANLRNATDQGKKVLDPLHQLSREHTESITPSTRDFSSTELRSLRGSHSLMIWLNESTSLDITINDHNRYHGEDNLIATIYTANLEKIANIPLGGDYDHSDSREERVIHHTLALDFLEPGYYLLNLESVSDGNDFLFTVKNPTKMLVDSRYYSFDSTNLSVSCMYDPCEISFKIYNDVYAQNLTFGNRTLQITPNNRYVAGVFSGDMNIFLPKGGVEITMPFAVIGKNISKSNLPHNTWWNSDPDLVILPTLTVINNSKREGMTDKYGLGIVGNTLVLESLEGMVLWG